MTIQLSTTIQLSADMKPSTRLPKITALAARLNKFNAVEGLVAEFAEKIGVSVAECKKYPAIHHLLEKGDEFVKNSIDASAKELIFSLSLENAKVKINIVDNGCGTAAALVPYDYKQAFRSDSSKKGLGAIGGANKGLAMAAHYVTLQKGVLRSGARQDGVVGFEIEVISPAEPHLFSFNHYEAAIEAAHFWEYLKSPGDFIEIEALFLPHLTPDEKSELTPEQPEFTITQKKGRPGFFQKPVLNLTASTPRSPLCGRPSTPLTLSPRTPLLPWRH